MKFRGKFIVLMVSLFGLISVSLLFFSSIDRRAALDVAIEKETEELEHFVYQVRERLDAYTLDIRILSDIPYIQGLGTVATRGGKDPVTGLSLPELGRWFRDIFERRVAVLPHYDRLVFTDARGRGIAGVRKGPTGIEQLSDSELASFADTTYLKEAIAANREGVYISNIELSEKFGIVEVPRRPLVHLVRRLADARGATMGFLSLSVSAGDFLDFFKILAREHQENLFLVDQDGYFLMDTEFPSREFGRQSVAGAKISDFYDVGNLYDFVSDPARVFVDSTGTPYIFSVVQYDMEHPERFLALFERIPLERVFAPITQKFYRDTLIAGVVFLGIIVFAYAYFINPMTRRMRANIGLMRLIQKGEFPDYQPPQGKDEVADTTAGLYEMSRRLRESDRELREADERLGVKLKELAVRNDILEDTKRAMVNILEDARVLENTLKEERDRFEAIITAMSEGLLVIDTQYRVVLSNFAAERMLGYRAAEVVGKDMTELIRMRKGEKQIHLVDLPFARMFADGKPVHFGMAEDIEWSTEYTKAFPVEITLAPLLKTGFIAAVIIFRNVRDWKELDMARSNFISTASHQLRTPLGIIRWYAEMLGEGNLDDTQKDFVERIYRGALRSIEVINLLLLIARMESGRLQITPERIAVDPFVHDMMRDFEGEFGQKKIKTSITIAPHVPDLFVDPTMAHEVLVNLISNSIRYTNEGGNVSVDVSMESSGMAQFAVKDDGIGIPEDSRKKIFQRFYRAPNAEVKIAGGSGLGLALAQTLVEKWRGKIWFVSEEGKGTVFYFTVPVVKSDNNMK